MLICSLVGYLLVAVSIITVNSLRYKNFFFAASDEAHWSEVQLVKEEKRLWTCFFVHFPRAPRFPSRIGLRSLAPPGPAVTEAGPALTGAAFAHRAVVPAPATPLGASSARYPRRPMSVSALLFILLSFLVFDLRSVTYQLTRTTERVITSVASWHLRAGAWSGSWTE